MSVEDTPLLRLTVPYEGGLEQTLFRAAQAARGHYEGREHRRLGYQTKDETVTVWFGEIVTP
jgi:hypothetical protein